MKRAGALLMNTALLTAAALLMRTIGLTFQVWLSGRIGAAGIGLMQLVLSVQILAVTVASSGVRFASTRLVSEQLGKGLQGNVKACVRHCMLYALFFGIVASAALLFSSELIGTRWIRDERTVPALKLLSISLPFMSCSAAMGGYFTAVQRVFKSAGVQILEQLIRISSVVLALSSMPNGDLEYACCSVVFGSVMGDSLSFLLMLGIYLRDRMRYSGRPTRTAGLTRRMLGIALPLAMSAYARSSLSTLQHLLVPGGLRRSGASSEAALAAYGTIQGMVMPVLTFPAAFFMSLAEMLIPELTEAQVAGRKAAVKYIVNRILRACLMFSVFAAAGLFAFAESLGQAVYKSAEAGSLIKLFAPLVVIMYMDTVTDGMLKGLGQHLYSMRYNIWDALISVLMVLFLLPVYAVKAYIFIIFFTECFNFALSIRRLSKVSSVSMHWRDLLLSPLCAIGSVSFSILLLRYVGFALTAAPLSIGLHVLVSAAIYLLLLRATALVSSQEVRSLRALLK